MPERPKPTTTTGSCMQGEWLKWAILESTSDSYRVKVVLYL